MAHPTFRQLATLLGGTSSVRSMAAAEGVAPRTRLSLRGLLAYRPSVLSIRPLPEPGPPRTGPGAGYLHGPANLLDEKAGPAVPVPPSLQSMDSKGTVISTDGRVSPALREIAQYRDGNRILRRVAELMAGPHDPALLTAMTQLAATGSQAYAAWLKNPTRDLTPYLKQLGMPDTAAAAANQQIMSDFEAAARAVRSAAGTMRHTMSGRWIAVSGEDDPPDFPVNVETNHPQYHCEVSVPTPLGTKPARDVKIRYTLTSQGVASVPGTPTIPPDHEVLLYIHGEGSKAEEADDFIPRLFELAASAGRSFTVVAFDQPSCGYSTMVSHLDVAPMPPTQEVAESDKLDGSAFAGSPILDFVERTIIAFVEQCILPFGRPITAIVGGSLGGHMALRLAASQRSWVRNVIAWSPASVMDHDSFFGFNFLGKQLGITFPQRMFANPQTAASAMERENSVVDSRSDFFNRVWYKDTFNPNDYQGVVGGIASAMIDGGYFAGPVAAAVAAGGAAVVVAAFNNLETVPPQPQMWYWDHWGSAPTYILESRLDRREVYNETFRQWHWRICEEMIGFKFDSLKARMTGPLLMMVGEKDDFPQVHFVSNVRDFAATLTGPAQGGLTIQDTGHSIHNERPSFLARQVLNFATRA